MTTRILRALATATIAALVTSPAWAADKEHRQLMADLRIMQEQVQQLQNALGVLNTALNDALKAVNARLDQQTDANRKAFADQKLLIDNLTNDLRVVREKVDDNNVRVGSLTQELDSLRQLVQQNLSRPPSTSTSTAIEQPDAGGTAPGGVPVGGATAPAVPPAVAAGTSPTKAWDQAFADYTAGLYDLAVDGFEAYIRNFPKSDMADDAQLMIGRTYINDAKYDKAVEALDKVIRIYPNSNSVPDAYYFKGLALQSLKQPERAREAFEAVAKTYPESTAAALARQKLVSTRP